MKSNIKPTARKDDLVVQETMGEVLVYDLKTNKAACLNETSAFVWQNCDGSNTIADIAQALGRKTNNDVNNDLVWLAIDELSKHKLLEEEVAAEYSFTGDSRRDVIKKIGLGTMIALPIVASIVAPAAAHAQSGTACSCPNGQANNATSCTNSPQCGAGRTCTGVSCNSSGNNCGTLNGTCV